MKNILVNDEPSINPYHAKTKHLFVFFSKLPSPISLDIPNPVSVLVGLVEAEVGGVELVCLDVSEVAVLQGHNCIVNESVKP